MMFTDPFEINYTLTEEEANSPMNTHLRGITRAVEAKAYHMGMLYDLCKIAFHNQMEMLDSKMHFIAGLAYDMGVVRPKSKNWSKLPRLILEETDLLIALWKGIAKNQRVPRTPEQLLLLEERTMILHLHNKRFIQLMKKIWTPLEVSPVKVRHCLTVCPVFLY